MVSKVLAENQRLSNMVEKLCAQVETGSVKSCPASSPAESTACPPSATGSKGSGSSSSSRSGLDTPSPCHRTYTKGSSKGSDTDFSTDECTTSSSCSDDSHFKRRVCSGMESSTYSLRTVSTTPWQVTRNTMYINVD